MEYEVPSYSDMSIAFRTCDMLYNKVRKNQAVKGKRQRAMVRGEYAVYHDIKFNAFTVTYVMLLFANRWYPILYIKECGESFVVRQTYNNDNQQTYTIIRRHAVERYVQRQVLHDEKHKLTDEEYIKYSRIISNKFIASSFCYDQSTHAYLLSYDGGSFIAIPLGESRLAYMLVQTFLTVSMMKQNQSIANGMSRRQSNQMASELDSPTLKHIATT